MEIWSWLSPARSAGIILLIGLGSLCLWGQAPRDQRASVNGGGSQSKDAIAAQAQAALRAGNYAVAIERFKELARENPNVGEIHSNLCIAYYFSGRFVVATHECRAAVRLKPSLVNAHYFLGPSLAESGYCNEALPYLEKDFRGVADRQLKRIIGTDTLRCYMDLNEADKGVNLDQTLVDEFPDDPEILYLTTHLYSNLSAIASQHLLAVASGSYQFHRMDAEVLELQGKQEDAIAEFQKALGMNPHGAGIHYAIGRLLLQQGPSTLSKAREEFEEELKIDPGNANAEFQLGNIAGSLRKWTEALPHLQRATKLNPKLVAAQIALGEAYVSAGQVADAVTPLEHAVKIAPGNPIAHYRLAFVFRRLGRDQEAEQQLAAYKKAEADVLQSKQRIRGSVADSQTNLNEGATDH
jgi:tetratricopeptide (TPR) repeat protein